MKFCDWTEGPIGTECISVVADDMRFCAAHEHVVQDEGNPAWLIVKDRKGDPLPETIAGLHQQPDSEEIVLETTTADTEPQADILEIDGPPRAYFEIPLDYTAADIDAGGLGYPEQRLYQRVLYYSFMVTRENRTDCVEAAGHVINEVTAELFKFKGGIIWWRKRPELEQGYDNEAGQIRYRVRLRLGTSPSLDRETWNRIGASIGNQSSDPSAPK